MKQLITLTLEEVLEEAVQKAIAYEAELDALPPKEAVARRAQDQKDLDNAIAMAKAEGVYFFRVSN